MAGLKTGTTIAGQTAWHAGNDGPGSGMDADTVDGLHATQLGISQVAASAPSARGVGDLWARNSVVSSSGIPGTYDDAWTNLTLTNGWYNYGNPYEPARFRKTIDGLLILGGLIRAGTWSGVAATLPVGYRPEYAQLMCALNDNWLNRFNIYPDGRIIPEQHASGVDWCSMRVVIWVG